MTGKKMLLMFSILFSCSQLFASTAFWCDAKEVANTHISDVSEFKALTVKKVTIDVANGERLITHRKNSTGLLEIDSKDVQSADWLSIVFQDSRGREYHVSRSPDNNLLLFAKPSEFTISGTKFLGLQGQIAPDANEVIIDCKSEM